MKTYRLSYLAVLTCLGLVLPSAFHIVGGAAAGSVLLPLHIPVLIAGLVLGAADGFFLGLFLPLLSALITGMPPPAVLPFMCVELSLYGFFCGFFIRLTKSGGIALTLSLFISRLVYAAFFTLLFFGFGLNVPTFTVVAATFVKGMPGIIIQLAIVPQLCYILRRYNFDADKRKLA